MTNQVIPAEAVEAAAKAVFLSGYPEGCGVTWDPESPIGQGIMRDVAIALEAATPHMQQRAAAGWTTEFPSFVLGRWRK